MASICARVSSMDAQLDRSLVGILTLDASFRSNCRDVSSARSSLPADRHPIGPAPSASSSRVIGRTSSAVWNACYMAPASGSQFRGDPGLKARILRKESAHAIPDSPTSRGSEDDRYCLVSGGNGTGHIVFAKQCLESAVFVSIRLNCRPSSAYWRSAAKIFDGGVGRSCARRMRGSSSASACTCALEDSAVRAAPPPHRRVSSVAQFRRNAHASARNAVRISIYCTDLRR
jgi:hypothetical protein